MTFAIFCRGHQPPLVEQSNRLVGGVGNVLAGAAAAGRNNYQSHDTLGGSPLPAGTGATGTPVRRLSANRAYRCRGIADLVIGLPFFADITDEQIERMFTRPAAALAEQDPR